MKQYLQALDNAIFLLKEYADELDKSNTNDVDGSQFEHLMDIKSNLKRLSDLYSHLEYLADRDADEVSRAEERHWNEVACHNERFSGDYHD
jgi:Na+/phosphate symporter